MHQFEEQNGKIKITLHSDKLAKNAFLQTDALGHFDDNYFDLLPGESKEVYFKAKNGKLEDGFSVKSLRDTYNRN
jgi:beta-mannosidase